VSSVNSDAKSANDKEMAEPVQKLSVSTLHQRVKIAVAAADVDYLIDDDWRRKNRTYMEHSVDSHNHVVIKVRGKCSGIFRRAIRLGVGRGALSRLIRLKCPRLLLRDPIDGDQPPAVGANVDHIPDDGWG